MFPTIKLKQQRRHWKDHSMWTIYIYGVYSYNPRRIVARISLKMYVIQSGFLLHGQSYLWHGREIIIPDCTHGVPVDCKLVVSFRFCFAELESKYDLTIDRETPHTSPSQARYGVSVMSGETRLDITGLHYHLKIRIHPGTWFNIKMTSYQYRKSHCGDKTIWRPSYLHNGISDTGKTTFYIESGPWSIHNISLLVSMLSGGIHRWRRLMTIVCFRRKSELLRRLIHFFYSGEC